MPETRESMPDLTSLLRQFAPVPTSEWEAAIVKDLKGADYDKRLLWKTDEGIAVRPYYRSDSAPPGQPLLRPSASWRPVSPGHEPALDVDATAFHEAGATAVQEIGFALAAAADRLAGGGAVATVGFAVGGRHILEIAKLRAGRVLLEQVREAFGAQAAGGAGEEAPAAAPLHVHARTAVANKTLFDPYVNLLRVTTEALSAVLGGCDSLAIVPVGFDPHLAENVHHILREESHLEAVVDPAAGAYAIEALTDEIAHSAWRLFQQVEAAGGLAAYRASGALDAALASARETRQKAFASRRRVLVGTNNYPDLRERGLDRVAAMPPGWRLAEAMEMIRLRTERHAKAAGRTPRVLLLERGDLKMRKARSAFCLNFFGCAGFDVVASDTLQDADIIVLCSSDAEYVALASEICPAARVPVIVAGNPKDQLAALEAAGVADYVHVLSNAPETLTRWQDRLGMKE